MSVNQEVNRNVGHMFCSPRSYHLYRAAKWKIGLVLVTIGLLLMGARVGLLDFTWLHSVYFWPMLIVLLGLWMVYKGLSRKYASKHAHHEQQK